MLRIVSFSYKHGQRPTSGLVFDCRDLPNPHNDPALRMRDGRDPAVQQYVMTTLASGSMLQRAELATKSENAIAFGCVGGRHRSVALVELLAKSDIVRSRYSQIQVVHQQLGLAWTWAALT